MNVLSLFDGISCGQVALKNAGIKVKNYYASEIDDYVIGITKNNFPNTIHLGNVENIDYSKLPKIDLLIGGSPCQGFSNAGDRLNFKDPRSKLFFEFVKALKTVKPKYFLLENVKMKAEWRDIITKHMGVEPIFINSVDFIPHHRQRYYWTNIPVKKWSAKKDTLSNYLEQNPDKKTFLSDTAIKRLESAQRFRGWFDESSSHIGCLTANYYKIPSDGSYVNYKGKKRRLSPIECERLQGLDDNYTQYGLFDKSKKKISNTQRYKAIGNGWTVNVISHIFSGIKTRRTKFRNMKRESKENMMNKLKSFVPDITDESFHISFENDDYGEHICVYIEKTADNKDSIKQEINTIIDGWRCVTILVPNEYIDGIGLREKK